MKQLQVGSRWCLFVYQNYSQLPEILHSNVYVISNVVVIARYKLRCNVEINVEASFVVVVKASLPEVNAIVFPAPFSPLR